MRSETNIIPLPADGQPEEPVDVATEAIKSGQSQRRVFHTLDLLRGIAAIVVVGRHANHELLGIFPSSGLAVDLFFVLSGFVIAHAYETKIRDGMGLVEFMTIRVIRLYPLYALGTLIGVVTALALAWLYAVPFGPIQLFASIVLAALFLPAPSALSFNQYHLFPFNFPGWSLYLEIGINGFYAVIARWLTNTRLLGLIALGATMLCLCAWKYGNLEGGSSAVNFYAGPLRVVYSFFAGVGLYRIWDAKRLQPPNIAFWIPAVLLLAVFAVRPEQPALYDLAMALFVSPALVWLGTREPPPSMVRPCLLLGLISYPIYVLHAPFSGITLAVIEECGAQVSPLPIELAYVASMIALALLADRYFDRPVRRLLTRLVPAALATSLGGSLKHK